MFNSWVRKILWRRKWQPTPVFLPRKSHGQRALMVYRPRGRKESDRIQRWNHHHHKTPQSSPSLSPCEGTVRRRLSASQGEGSHQELASTLILDFLVCRGHNFHTCLLSASHCRIVWVSPGPVRVQTDHINCLSFSLHFLHLNDDPSWALTHWKWQWADSLQPYE